MVVGEGVSVDTAVVGADSRYACSSLKKLVKFVVLVGTGPVYSEVVNRIVATLLETNN